MKRLFWTLVLGCALVSVSAQQVNTLYFLENSPHRHYINPALAPISRIYISMPVIGYTSLNVGNNALVLSDLVYNKNGQTVTFLHPEYGDRQGLMKALRKDMIVDANLQIGLLSFGRATKRNGYWHVTLTERIDLGVGLPKGLFGLLLNGGMTDLNGTNNFNLKALGLNASMYTELGVGYMRHINEHWAIGGKLKFLYGHAYVNIENKDFDLNASSEEWNLKGSGYAMIAAPISQYPASLTLEDIQNNEWLSIDAGNPMNMVMDLVKPQGLGGALDFGITYKPHKQIQISAAVADLGVIAWNKGKQYNYTIDGTYTGVGEIKYEDYYNDETQAFDTDRLVDTVTTHLKGIYENAFRQDGERMDGFFRMTNPRLNIGVDANFWNNRIGLGILSQTKFTHTRIYEEVTLGAAFRPCHWFQLAASYSFLNGKSSNIGAALGFVTYEGIGLTLAADYVPCTYADYEGIPLPYGTKGLNLTFGLNIVINHKQDKDRDGVKDFYDLCPDTPRKVKVDKDGCPLDTDGDGVADYLDQCPETPVAAYNYIDANGCPTDTDGDKVPDYLDQCPNTPAEAYGKVDSVGCPLDTDGDGVADYLDKCPDTPTEANRAVDSAGCLLDADNDGVPDYLDQCPNTPAEAYGKVDAVGCPLDTDGDGVADYLDECPDTPAEAKRFVDDKGCMLDSDNDSVPDYLDQCPHLAGIVENNGCPAVKKEVRTLLTKAMKGIQFETGNAVIKKESYAILDLVATIFIENPTYRVEVQGHTDNVGDPAKNLTLSENRANAVRDYLIAQGVPAEQLTAKGYGDTMPIADNSTQAGQAENRRVEFAISFEEVTYEEVIHSGDTIN